MLKEIRDLCGEPVVVLLRLCLGGLQTVLGGSWVVISGVLSPLIWVITIVTLLITPLITTHEPPSSAYPGISQPCRGRSRHFWLELVIAWRFMGSYKSGYKQGNYSHNPH